MGNPLPSPTADPSGGAPHPKDANQKNQDEASEADKRTVAKVQEHQSKGEKDEPDFRTPS